MQNITRHEIKYIITKNALDSLVRDLGAFLVPNKYFAQTIHNIYFDNETDDLILRSIEKKEFKDKLRLRVYDMDGTLTSPIIELKKKYKGTSYKRRIKLKLDEAQSILDGAPLQRTGQIPDEIRFLVQRTACKPKMYIGYDRQSYDVAGHPDLRITFDTNVRSRTSNLAFATHADDRQLLAPDQYIMEIKAATAFPLWLTEALTKNKIFPDSFSKYARAFLLDL